MPRKLAAGNWKMNGDAAALREVADLMQAHAAPGCEVLLCPPFTLIDRMRTLVADGPIAVGGQDCHPAQSGAHTGDISAGMLKDAGASHVIVGHSERRQDHGETNETVRTKAEAVIGAGLVAIVCVGETEAERDAGDTLDLIRSQLAGSVPRQATADTLVIAYEPVWAIGTGRTPTLEQIAEVHDFIRGELGGLLADGSDADVRLLYGGSVKPGNAAEIFGVSNVDGALVGGASLKAADFGGIIAALQEAG